ncbi:PD-(D/E)XK nuclease family protein, partial [Leptolyngbya sp. FACHB-36]|nr:PD-(D/E)XK nuclease family protein [Leptolyngbya sp. FACHB-36]
DTRQHEQTRQDLSHLLDQLTHWLDRYQLGEPFPQLGIAANQCERCGVAARCVEPDADDRADSILTLADIQEVPL